MSDSDEGGTVVRIVAPFGRDADSIAAVLAGAGLRTGIAPSLEVLAGQLDVDVAVHGGDQAEVDLGAGQRQQDGQGVVDAGVGVDDQGRGSGHGPILDDAGGGRHAGCAEPPPG